MSNKGENKESSPKEELLNEDIIEQKVYKYIQHECDTCGDYQYEEGERFVRQPTMINIEQNAKKYRVFLKTQYISQLEKRVKEFETENKKLKEANTAMETENKELKAKNEAMETENKELKTGIKVIEAQGKKLKKNTKNHNSVNRKKKTKDWK